MNTIGSRFRFTSFGESHGVAVGGVIDGCPAGLIIDFDAIEHDLDRRSGRVDNPFATSVRAKNEADTIEWLSGLNDGKTLGTPIAFLVRNSDVHSADYDSLRDVCRPGHADFTYLQKYGKQVSGGGRASARETVARVVAGGIAKQILKAKGVSINAQIVQVGAEKGNSKWADYVRDIAACGDSIGGIVRCVISGMPVGIGEPIFDKVQSRLAAAMLSINACKGFDYGSGFEGVEKRGSELNDCYEKVDASPLHIKPKTNHAGGLLGGITTSEDIVFRCVFKPVPSIAMTQHTVDNDGTPIELQIKGRHDACFLPRVLPVVEAMAAMVLVDYMI
ncbi:MAG: chorismate synthase [Paludibacteraceae bacterium]|nr:chorismate synthase [Paludibacteraceae bacterium]